MSLYGALFTGVSGLNAQGQKIGIISDNIANVNTNGYKRAKAEFETLVVTQAGSSVYSPGGVLADAKYAVDEQGLLSASSIATDIAISGSGFYAVNALDNASGQPLYTRAGSFRQDATGSFQNSGGFYLQGWPLTNGLRPGEPGNSNTTPTANLDSLETVNVASATGIAAATTNVEIGVNLKASEVIFPGSGVTVTMDQFSVNNFGISATDIIVPDEASITPPSFGLSTENNIKRGDRFRVETGNGQLYDYQYGGFTVGRKVTISGTANIGDNVVDLTPVNFAAGDVTVANGSNVVNVTAVAHGLSTGDRVVINTATWAGALSNISLSEINQEQVVTVTGANTYTFAVATTATSAHSNAGTGNWTDRLFAGRILDASTVSQSFFTTSNLSDYTTLSRSFTITSATAGSATFTYTSGSPQASAGQFSNLTNLASAIKSKVGLEARVVDGRLMISAEDASEALTFSNGDSTGSVALKGIDWARELGVADVTSVSRRFNTMSGLANIMNSDQGVTAVVTNPTGETTMVMRVDDPLDTIQFSDFATTAIPMQNNAITVTAANATVAAGAVTVTINQNAHGLSVGQNIILSGLVGFNGFTAGELNAVHTVTNVIDANTFDVVVTASSAAGVTTGLGGGVGGLQETNTGSLLSELGLVSSLRGGGYVQGNTGLLGPEYDSSGVNGKNMASGDITAQFSKTSRIFDALGTAHDIRFSFIKTDINEWAVEVHAANPTEVSSSLVDGQITVGTIQFNGDGSLLSISSSLIGNIAVNWSNGAQSSNITFDLGTAGLPAGTIGANQIGGIDGLTQFDSTDYKDVFVNQDGSAVGDLISITIDEDGFVIASFDNGESKSLYQLPIASFRNPNGLTPVSGNVFTQSRDSGDVTLRKAGETGAGKIISGSLEQSNVDLATELTDMIIAQRGYQANTRVISTADELLEQLNQI